VNTPDSADYDAGLPPICGAVKLVPLAFLQGTAGFAGQGLTQMAYTCVREPGHPERDADSSLHLCGEFAWPIGPDDDYRRRT
jgi:hypothetical protein